MEIELKFTKKELEYLYFAIQNLFIVLTNQTQPTQPTEATVVDTYKGCDIVRWSNGQMAEYKYFLHCNNTRPVYGK